MSLAEHLTVRREAGPPVSEQLAFQIAAAIGEGRHVREGDRLPGARSLARRLGVHRNTVLAVYRRLARRGLVEPRPGSGTYVRPAGGGQRAHRSDPFKPQPARWFRGLLAAHRRAGRRRARQGGSADSVGAVLRDVERARGVAARERARPEIGVDARSLGATFRAWTRAVTGSELRLVGEASELRTLRAAELSRVLPSRRVVGVEPGAVSDDPAWWSRGPVVCDPGRLDAVGARAPLWAPLFDVPAADAELERALTGAPRNAVVLLVSDSQRMAERAHRAAAVLHGRTLSCAHVRPSAEGGLARAERVLPVAHFVLVDLLARQRLSGLRTPGVRRPRWRGLWAQSPAALRELGRYLGGGRKSR